MQITFKLMNVEGQEYSIPAEVITTKFPRHRFVVHKSLGLDDAVWMVSHFNSGGLVFYADTKEAAIKGAQDRLALNTAFQLNQAIDACYAQRAKIITDQQMKLASSQKATQAKEEKKQAAAVARSTKVEPVSSEMVTAQNAA